MTVPVAELLYREGWPVVWEPVRTPPSSSYRAVLGVAIGGALVAGTLVAVTGLGSDAEPVLAGTLGPSRGAPEIGAPVGVEPETVTPGRPDPAVALDPVRTGIARDVVTRPARSGVAAAPLVAALARVASSPLPVKPDPQPQPPPARPAPPGPLSPDTAGGSLQPALTMIGPLVDALPAQGSITGDLLGR
jgi:hypothetical protein